MLSVYAKSCKIHAELQACCKRSYKQSPERKTVMHLQPEELEIKVGPAWGLYLSDPAPTKLCHLGVKLSPSHCTCNPAGAQIS